ncbi:type II secretion system F family protein [soil metagenome]
MPHLSIPAIVFLILIFAAAFTAVQAAVGLLQVVRVKLQVNRRLVLADKIGSINDLVIELRKERGLNADGERRLAWLWFADLVLRSGVAYRPKRWALMAVGAGIAAGAGVMIGLHSPVWAAIAGVIVALASPFATLTVLAGRRAKALGAQLPNALDVIVRSLEAGHPVPTAVALVGREMPDPIGTEFGMAADEISFGAALEQAVNRMADRCRHPDVDLFAATVRLQERAGGNLTGLLKTNARTIRERQRMRLKIKAASSEGRASAIILTSAPFFVLGILTFSSPHFYGDVIHEPVIQIGLAILGTWMFIGNMVMRRMIDMRI